MAVMKDDLEEDLPWFVDLVNLNKADNEFLTNIRPDIKFLAGNYRDFAKLKEILELEDMLDDDAFNDIDEDSIFEDFFDDEDEFDE